ncbi:dual specificity phosphatase 19-like [Brachionus plicatilis]|uniref:protein-tyrosine-phosphatase n=1 Tax=Brachionus plicatilis TaxID=10195 RepID=A0A3M7RNQ7_BRAPC|nr:dual specificity phosphatase 19-like [Brachionus plicatilis]
MINDKLKNKSIYLHHYELHKRKPNNDQSNRTKVSHTEHTFIRVIKQGENEANKKSKEKYFTVNPAKLRIDKEQNLINEISKSNSAMNLDKLFRKENTKSSVQKKQNTVASYHQFSYMDAFRLYRKQKFLEEYLRINGDAATQIIPNFLYLGGHNSIKNVAELTKYGITHVLNMAQELSLNNHEYLDKKIKILQISAKDAEMYNIRPDFDLAFMFIDDCLRSGGKIVVNCARGISRSATIVIAYLMFRYNLRLDQAYSLVSSLRPQVRPNIGFRNILGIYDLELEYARVYRLNNFREMNQKIAYSVYQTQAVYSQN